MVGKQSMKPLSVEAQPVFPAMAPAENMTFQNEVGWIVTCVTEKEAISEKSKKDVPLLKRT